VTIDLPDPAATQSLGHRLGQLLFPGAVVALVGPLGAGKTFLARAIAEGLGIPDSRVVNSPTFVLIQEYQARLPIYHFDVYRLHVIEQFADLGVHEYFTGDGVCLVEWADRVASLLPKDRLWIELEVTGEASRRMHLQAAGPKYDEVLRNLAAAEKS
jgi:tRNA threonylcarbamoyladenosine biosynthesis protein TsaE